MHHRTGKRGIDAMNESSRRNFLIVAGSGAATAAVAAALPTQADASAPGPTTLPNDAPPALVAYISDVNSGEMSLLVDNHEVVIHDKDLVARLARAAR
jgi:hypothetical protein